MRFLTDIFMNKYFIKIVPLFVIFFLSACQKEDYAQLKLDDKGVVISTPFIWKTSLHQKEPESNSYINNPIIYNDNIVVPTTNGKDNRLISMINTKNGEIMWHWNDLIEYESGDKGYIDIAFHYQYQNLITFQSGSRSYCINLDNGKTHWKIRRDRTFDPRLDHFDQYYLSYASIDPNNSYDEQITFKGDIATGIISEFLRANVSHDCPDCRKGITHITQVPNQDNLILVTYGENLPDWFSQIYFGLYDTDSKEWIWDKALLLPPTDNFSTYHTPRIVNNKIYAEITNYIVCHDLTTGKQLWKEDINGNAHFASFIVEEGKVITNSEAAYAYAFDAVTGYKSWSVPTAGTCSRLSYLNGIVYFVGGSGGGRFFAIEVSSGKLLWKIDAALLGDGYGASFKTNAVYVLPAKNNEPAKVIALSHKNAYCFEAIR